MILQTRHFAPKNYGIVRTTPYHFPPRDLTTRMSHDARISLTGQNTDAMLSLSRLTSSLRELAHGGQDEVGPIMAGLVSEAWELILKIPLDGDGAEEQQAEQLAQCLLEVFREESMQEVLGASMLDLTPHLIPLASASPHAAGALLPPLLAAAARRAPPREAVAALTEVVGSCSFSSPSHLLLPTALPLLAAALAALPRRRLAATGEALRVVGAVVEEAGGHLALMSQSVLGQQLGAGPNLPPFDPEAESVSRLAEAAGPMLVCPVAQFMEAVWGQVVEGEVGACGGGGSGADTQQQQQLARRVAQALAVVCLQAVGQFGSALGCPLTAHLPPTAASAMATLVRVGVAAVAATAAIHTADAVAGGGDVVVGGGSIGGGKVDILTVWEAVQPPAPRHRHVCGGDGGGGGVGGMAGDGFPREEEESSDSDEANSEVSEDSDTSEEEDALVSAGAWQWAQAGVAVAEVWGSSLTGVNQEGEEQFFCWSQDRLGVMQVTGLLASALQFVARAHHRPLAALDALSLLSAGGRAAAALHPPAPPHPPHPPQRQCHPPHEHPQHKHPQHIGERHDPYLDNNRHGNHPGSLQPPTKAVVVDFAATDTAAGAFAALAHAAATLADANSPWGVAVAPECAAAEAVGPALQGAAMVMVHSGVEGHRSAAFRAVSDVLDGLPPAPRALALLALLGQPSAPLATLMTQRLRREVATARMMPTQPPASPPIPTELAGPDSEAPPNIFLSPWPLAAACQQLVRALHGDYHPTPAHAPQSDQPHQSDMEAQHRGNGGRRQVQGESVPEAQPGQEQQPQCKEQQQQLAALQQWVGEAGGDSSHLDAAAAALALLRLLLLTRRGQGTHRGRTGWEGAEELPGRLHREVLAPLHVCLTLACPPSPWLPQGPLPSALTSGGDRAGGNQGRGQGQRSVPVGALEGGVERALAVSRLSDVVGAVVELMM